MFKRDFFGNINYQLSLLRSLALLLFKTVLPPLPFILSRNPCVLCFLIFFGWLVLFGIKSILTYLFIIHQPSLVFQFIIHQPSLVFQLCTSKSRQTIERFLYFVSFLSLVKKDPHLFCTARAIWKASISINL